MESTEPSTTPTPKHPRESPPADTLRRASKRSGIERISHGPDPTPHPRGPGPGQDRTANMTDYVATRTGDRVHIELSTGWTITHTDGRRLGDITAPSGSLIDAMQVVEWNWAPTEGGTPHATTTATVESLAAALDEYVRDHDDLDDPSTSTSRTPAQNLNPGSTAHAYAAAHQAHPPEPTEPATPNDDDPTD